MGSKKCKALVVEGNGSVNVKDPQAVADLSDYMLRELIGSNNNHVVPSTQQEWPSITTKAAAGTLIRVCIGRKLKAARLKPASRNQARSTPWASAAC